MKTPHVTVIVLNWKNKQLLVDNLPSVLDQSYSNYSALLVDNGSADDSLEYIRKISEESRIVDRLELDANLGYVGGNNAGIKYVLDKDKSKYVVFLNNDVRVEKDWLQNLINGFDSDEIGITTSNIRLYYPYVKMIVSSFEQSNIRNLRFGLIEYYNLVYRNGFEQAGEFLELPITVSDEAYKIAIPVLKNGKETLSYDIDGKIKLQIGDTKHELEGSGQIELNVNSQFVTQNAGTDFIKSRMVFKDRHIFEFENNLKTELVDASCGGAMAVRTDLLKKYGGFVSSYFMYSEDSELSYRYAREGYKSKLVADAICYHVFWGSSGNKETATHIYYGNRNRLHFIRKHFGFGIFLYHWIKSFGKTILYMFQTYFKQTDYKVKYSNRLRALKDVWFMK